MALLILLIVSASLGTWALRPFGPAPGLEGVCHRLYVGLSLTAVLILLVGSAFSLRAVQLVMDFLAAGGLAFELFLYSKRVGGAEEPVPARARFTGLEIFCLATTAAAMGFSLLASFAPVTGTDASAPFLAIAKNYARESRFATFPLNSAALAPHLVYALYTYVFYESGEGAEVFVSWFFGALACSSIYFLAVRVENRRTAFVAAAILATAPVFFREASAVSVDLAYCGLTLTGLACFLAWRDEPDARRRSYALILAAFLLGSACGIRGTGYAVCAFLLAATVFRGTSRRLRDGLTFAGICLASAAPWLIRTLMLTDNPVQTMAGALAAGVARHDATTRLAGLLAFPWDVVMRPQSFGGWTASPGGLVLFLGIPGLIVGGRRARLLGLFAAAGAAVVFLFEPGARNMLPFFAAMMVAGASAVTRLQTLRYVAVAAFAVSVLFGLALNASAAYSKLPVVLGFETREDYLARTVERYPAFQWINNQRLAPDDVVLTFDSQSFFIDGRAFDNVEALQPLTTQPMKEQVEWLKRHHIRWVILPVTYIEESPKFSPELRAMVNAWRRARRYFHCVKTMEILRPKSNKLESVEIYEVRRE